MFKEILEDMVALVAPITKLPEFIDKKPFKLISVIGITYNLSSNTDKYARIIFSEDKRKIYVVYRGLKKDSDTLYMSDMIMYDGNLCLLVIVDEYALFDSENAQLTSDTLLLMISDIIIYLKAMNVNMFYKKSGNLKVIFDQSNALIYIQMMLTIYRDGDQLRDIMYGSMKRHYPNVEKDNVDEYVRLLDGTPISDLLDNSFVMPIGTATCINSKGESKDETETV